MSRGGRPSDEEHRSAEARARMVRDQLRSRGIRDAAVLWAFSRVPRERFVASDLGAAAYDDRALGIGGGQTISQPYMVARMTEALDLGGWPQRHAGDFRRPRVLDVGTGSGYQAAVLAELAADVVGVERDHDLATEARERLGDAGYIVRVEVGDGSEGFPALAPYAGIVVAAAAPSVPAPLIDQLDVGGRVVIPVGTRERQVLTVVERGEGEDRRWELDPCVFVPLVGRYGFGA